MDKIWFIELNGQKHGPFSVKELKYNHSITPDTLVWREGFPNWIAIRKVPELQEIFEDEPRPEEEDVEKPENKLKKLKDLKAGKDEIALNLQSDIPPILWILLILFLTTYVLYWIYQ